MSCADSLRVFLCTSMTLYFTPKSTHTCCAVHCLLKICHGCFSGQKNRSLCFFIEFLILDLQILVFSQAAFPLLGFKVLHRIQIVGLSMHSCLPSVSLSLAVLQRTCRLLEVQHRCQQLGSCEKMTRVKRNPVGSIGAAPT